MEGACYRCGSVRGDGSMSHDPNDPERCPACGARHPDRTAHRCGDCRRPAKVLMRIGVDRDDWVYATCDGCLDYLCAVHHEENGEQTYCDTCYQHRTLLRIGVLRR